MMHNIFPMLGTAGLVILNKEKIGRILKKEKIDRKIKELKSNAKRGMFINRLKLFRMLIRDYWQGRCPDVPWRTVAAVAFAILYFFNPVDLVPDVIPIVGYVDDIAVLAMVWKATEADLKQYARTKRLALKEYFG